MSEQLRAELQQALDDLFTERLIPFKLTAGKLELIGPAEYIIHFYDSRLTSVEFSCRQGQSCQEALRIAVMDSVQRLPGPLRRRDLPAASSAAG